MIADDTAAINAAIERLAEIPTSKFDEIASLVGLNLKTDFAGGDLRGANLSGIDFSHANLEETDLTGAVLTFTKFAGASLVGATLCDADASSADFSHTNLSASDFTGAITLGAKFEGAILAGSKGLEIPIPESAKTVWSETIDDNFQQLGKQFFSKPQGKGFSFTNLLPNPLARPYRFIRIEWDPEFGRLLLRMGVKPTQCFSFACLAEIKQVFDDIEANTGLVRHLVVASDVTGVFNFGTDLSLVVLLSRARDLDSLRLYGRRVVEMVWWLENASRRGVTTTVLVQGDVMGSGLEFVLAFHNIVFERSAQAGLPEVLFNMFPGSGAWPLTIRRGGLAVAKDLILKGLIFTADQLYRRGLVDFICDDGDGEAMINEIARSSEGRLRGTIAAQNALQTWSPINYAALQENAELWSVTALGLTNRDIRLMERLARAQFRKVGGSELGAVDEIKRLELDSAWNFERTGSSEWTSAG